VVSIYDTPYIAKRRKLMANKYQAAVEILTGCTDRIKKDKCSFEEALSGGGEIPFLPYYKAKVKEFTQSLAEIEALLDVAQKLESGEYELCRAIALLEKEGEDYCWGYAEMVDRKASKKEIAKFCKGCEYFKGGK
jgi:hypothetical protein